MLICFKQVSDSKLLIYKYIYILTELIEELYLQCFRYYNLFKADNQLFFNSLQIIDISIRLVPWFLKFQLIGCGWLDVLQEEYRKFLWHDFPIWIGEIFVSVLLIDIMREKIVIIKYRENNIFSILYIWEKIDELSLCNMR